jgi:hypothetical protein
MQLISIRVAGLALVGLIWYSYTVRAQTPSPADSTAIVELARQKAFHYTQSLPDFECAEVVRRSASAGGPNDTLTIKLSYTQRAEVHKLLLINGRATDQKYESLEGVTSSGEFGGILRVIFDPAMRATFEWKSWKEIRKHRVATYEYAVSAANSPYYLRHQGRHAIVGIHGVVEIDAVSGEVLHLTYICYDIPKELGLTSASTTVDYDFADVGGRNYLLPARSETLMRSPGIAQRNRAEFRDYHKFSADSVVDFGPAK